MERGKIMDIDVRVTERQNCWDL